MPLLVIGSTTTSFTPLHDDWRICPTQPISHDCGVWTITHALPYGWCVVYAERRRILARTSWRVHHRIRDGKTLAARDSLASKEGIQVLKLFNSPYVNGASIKAEALNIDALLSLPEVANVWRNNVTTLEPLKWDSRQPRSMY